MVKYTWDDVIVNPNDIRLEGAIGKYVYYAITPFECIRLANNNNIYSLDRLEYIQKECDGIFIVGKTSYPCIIIKKEEPKEYVPFDTIEEFIKASLEHNKEHILSKVGGIWVKEKPKPEIDSKIFIISIDCFEFTEKELCFGEIWNCFDELLKGYTFLDDTPCGKLKE